MAPAQIKLEIFVAGRRTRWGLAAAARARRRPIVGVEHALERGKQHGAGEIDLNLQLVFSLTNCVPL
jgi:hypothetical protein